MPLYLQSLLTAFSQMDIEKLQLLLKDEYSYQDTTKEIFLEKVKVIFEEHQQLGDTALVPFKGKCGGEECENCGKGGYRFVGNQSKNYLDLIFVEKGGDVKDIFDCNNFKTEEDAGELQSSDSIRVYRDEEISFEKTPAYWSNLNAALAAHEEMITEPLREVTLADVQYWLSKHRFTYEAIGEHDIFQPMMKWSEFAELYEELKQLAAFTTKWESEIFEAVREVGNITDEESTLAWLLKFEDIFESLPFAVRYGSISKMVTNKGFEGPVPLAIKDPIMEALSSCSDFYLPNHSEMLNKYGTYTDDETLEILHDEKYLRHSNHIFSLKFHLTRREEAKELGIEIPLFLNPNKEDSNPRSEVVSGDVPPF